MGASGHGALAFIRVFQGRAGMKGYIVIGSLMLLIALFIGCSEQFIDLLDSKVEKYLDKYAYELGLEGKDVEREEDDESHEKHTEENWEKYAERLCDVIEDHSDCNVDVAESCDYSSKCKDEKSAFDDCVEESNERTDDIIEDADTLSDDAYDSFSSFFEKFLNFTRQIKNRCSKESTFYKAVKCGEEKTEDFIDDECEF